MGVFSKLGDIMATVGDTIIDVGKVIDKTIESVRKPWCIEHSAMYSGYPPTVMMVSSGIVMVSLECTEHPSVLMIFPHTYHDFPPMYRAPSSVLRVAPQCTRYIPWCTQHPPMYSVMSPWYPEHPPGILNIPR